MTPEDSQRLEAAEILYRNTPSEELTNFESLEKVVRKKMKWASESKNRFFFIKQLTGTQKGRARLLKSIVGLVKVTDKQAQIWGLKPYSQISPLLEKSCLLLSANESFQNGEKDVETLTGIKVSHSTLQRLVQRTEYQLPSILQGVSEVCMVSSQRKPWQSRRITQTPQSSRDIFVEGSDWWGDRQWQEGNIPQMLQLRCAYLNGQLTAWYFCKSEMLPIKPLIIKGLLFLFFKFQVNHTSTLAFFLKSDSRLDYRSFVTLIKVLQSLNSGSPSG